MGILRSDRITGLGGANAITGSVQFFGSNYISVGKSSDFALGTGDWTVEYWAHQSSEVAYQRHFYLIGSSSSNIDGIFADGSGISFGRTNVWAPTQVTHVDERWNHYALVHDSTNMRLYINGTQVLTSTDNFGTDSEKELIIGYSNSTFGGNFDGYISNFRIENGFARYTSAFTPPNTRLTKTENTTFLGLQSSSNVLQEETGKVIVLNRSTTDSTGPIASRFTPNTPVGFSTTTDVGSQYGTTFDGFTVFATSTYMVPPGGNTRERNRGRGLIFGGYSPSPAGHVSTIQSIEIQSFGNAQDFGDLSSVRSQMGAVSSSTRAVSCGGGNDTPSDYTDTNTCEFVTIASTSNTTDFGDLSVSRQPYKASSNDTRGIIFGGYIHPTNSNTIDFITIATTGNATDFGDEIDTNRAGASCSSTTRGIVAGGFPFTNRISFVEIATTGNAQDFGDLLNSVFAPSGCSDKTRGVFAGGATPTAINVIQFITMSSAGDATDFGDLNTTEKVGSKGNSNSIRGIFSGGYDGGTFVNSISAITIATTGNAVDFGDISGTLRYAAGTSDSHGGLS